MRALALLLAFLLELLAVAGVATLGPALFGTGVPGWVAFVVLLVAVIAFWARYMAPRSPRRLRPPWYYVAQAVVFAIAAGSLVLTVGWWAGVVFAVLAIVDDLMLRRPPDADLPRSPAT